MRFRSTRRQQARQARGQPDATLSSVRPRFRLLYLSLSFSLFPLEYLVRWMTCPLDIQIDLPVRERTEKYARVRCRSMLHASIWIFLI